MYDDTTVEGIKTRMIDRLSTEFDTREGSFVNDVLSAAAAEICECYHSLDAMLPMFYVDATSGEYIDQQAGVVGVQRKAGTKAQCKISFVGSSGAVVPSGATFYTATGLGFVLAAAVTLTASGAQGTLVAESVGEAYNIRAGELVSTLTNYSGITSYRNEAASGGTDPETDQSLLERYLERMRRAATSGNAAHYQMWANSVDGVGASRVIAKWNGNGTVKVLLADPDFQPVSETVRAACAAYVDKQRPVGSSVTVASAKARNITVVAQVTTSGSTATAEVQAALGKAVRSYLRDLAAAAFAENIDLQVDKLEAKTYTLLYNRIAFLLLSIPGVLDYKSLTVCGGTANLSLQADELPVLTEVTVS